MHHVIIGAGPAGVTACDTLRKLDPGAEITLIGDEPEPPYSRMAIPYLLVDKIGEEGTYLRRDADHYERRRIEVSRVRVRSVDSAGQRLNLSDGAVLDYDRLLIATGSSPMMPPIPGIESEGVLPCWTLEDAREIARPRQPGKPGGTARGGFHRLHHPRGARQAGRGSHRCRAHGPHGPAHDEPDRGGAHQALVRAEGCSRVHRSQGDGDSAGRAARRGARQRTHTDGGSGDPGHRGAAERRFPRRIPGSTSIRASW